MTAMSVDEGAQMGTKVALERPSDRELVVRRTVNAPARLVFEAWTKPELFERWWVPKSFPVSLRSCELDVRVGGGYRLVFGHEDSTMEFFGRYVEVSPDARLAWTNDEEGGGQITTVTFEERDGRTVVVVSDLYPSKDALDEAIASGSTGIDSMPESLQQLEELLGTLA
jgi:uncharacterized protein YndB with AHSA1/START domain